MVENAKFTYLAHFLKLWSKIEKKNTEMELLVKVTHLVNSQKVTFLFELDDIPHGLITN